jgi:integrase
MVDYYIRGDKICIKYYVDGKRVRKSTGLNNTPENIKLVKKHIIPELITKITTGEIYKDVDKITRLDIKNYLLSLDMKSISKNTYKSAIKEIFELAVDDGVILNNPAINIKLPNDTKDNIEYFTKEEVNKLLENATGVIKPYLLIAFNTGMRPEEILGLQFKDIKDGYIDIKRVKTKGRIDTPKTKNSFRKVPIPNYILPEIEKLKGKTFYLFGDRSDASHLRYQWKKVLKDSNVRYRKLYSTRHTFATLMLQDNIVSINELAGLLGHSSPKVTLSHYAGVIETSQVKLDRDFNLFCHKSDTEAKTIG